MHIIVGFLVLIVTLAIIKSAFRTTTGVFFGQKGVDKFDRATAAVGKGVEVGASVYLTFFVLAVMGVIAYAALSPN